MLLRSVGWLVLSMAGVMAGCDDARPAPLTKEDMAAACDGAAKNQFTPGGVFLAGEWTFEKKDSLVVGRSVAKGQNYAGALFDSPILCVLTGAEQASLVVKKVDFDTGGTFIFDHVKDRSPELDFHDKMTGSDKPVP